MICILHLLSGALSPFPAAPHHPRRLSASALDRRLNTDQTTISAVPQPYSSSPHRTGELRAPSVGHSLPHLTDHRPALKLHDQ
ncbi:hypothetical protein CRG98_045180, partial [Punica granatum]